MQIIWEDLGLKDHYEGESSPKMFQNALKDMIEEMCPWLTEEINKGFMPFECYIENFYCRTVQNFGFNGEEVGLPVEVSYRLLELFIFFHD